MSHHTQPTQPLPEWGYAEPRRRRLWPWLVIFGVLIVLGVIACFVAEAAARDVVERTISDRVIKELQLPADQEVQVDVEGVVIPQLIKGRLDTVTIASDAVAVGTLSGDISVTAHDVRVREPYGMSSATATVSLDDEQLRALLATVDGLPADTVGLADPNVTMTVDLSLLGASVPVSIALTPSAQDGKLILTPATASVGDAEVTADELKERFGGLADAVLRDWPVCVASHLPEGITLTSATVTGDRLVTEYDIADGFLDAAAPRPTGTCE